MTLEELKHGTQLITGVIALPGLDAEIMAKARFEKSDR